MSLLALFVWTISDAIAVGISVLALLLLGAAWLLIAVSDWNLRRQARRAQQKGGRK